MILVEAVLAGILAGTITPARVAAPAPAPVVVAEVPSVTEGAGSIGYLPCTTADGPGPCVWDHAVRGGEASYIVDSLGGRIYLAGADR